MSAGLSCCCSPNLPTSLLSKPCDALQRYLLLAFSVGWLSVLAPDLYRGLRFPEGVKDLAV